MKIRVEQVVTASAYADIDLPDGRTWEDVEDFSLRYDELTLTFKDGEQEEFQLGSELQEDMPETKRPIPIYITDEDGNTLDAAIDI